MTTEIKITVPNTDLSVEYQQFDDGREMCYLSRDGVNIYMHPEKLGQLSEAILELMGYIAGGKQRPGACPICSALRESGWGDDEPEIVTPEKPVFTYNWNNAPDWAMWAAVDVNGKGYWYKSEPEMSKSTWVSGGVWYVMEEIPCSCPDWRDSKQARPK